MSLQGTSTQITETPIEESFLQMFSGYWVSQAIYVAAKLGIADLLAERQMSHEELAASTGSTHPASLYRLLRALSGIGIFVEGDDAKFSLTPLATPLLKGKGSMRSMVIHMGEKPSWQAWGELLHSVTTGETAFIKANGVEVFPYYAEHPESKEPFDQAMTEFSDSISEAVTKAYDFSPFHKIVDVGGGHGGLLTSILKANPNAAGVVFDLPSTAEGAEERIAAEGLAQRCEVVGGDFFQSLPADGDAYIMKLIIHDWDEERALAILKNIHRAMPDGGKLFLVETLVPETNEPAFAKLFDLHMMVMTGGRERTAGEYAKLFAAAGFKFNKVTATESLLSIIEADKA
jgi:ubiquinone/menaquinone biosynthesis C-methylase UbiE